MTATAVLPFLPAVVGSSGRCSFAAWSGLDCAACGGTRAVHALAAGRPVDAVDHNALLVLAAVVAGLGVLALLASRRARRLLASRPSVQHPFRPLLVVLVGWTLLRNLPGLGVLSSGLA